MGDQWPHWWHLIGDDRWRYPHSLPACWWSHEHMDVSMDPGSPSTTGHARGTPFMNNFMYYWLLVIIVADGSILNIDQNPKCENSSLHSYLSNHCRLVFRGKLILLTTINYGQLLVLNFLPSITAIGYMSIIKNRHWQVVTMNCLTIHRHCDHITLGW